MNSSILILFILPSLVLSPCSYHTAGGVGSRETMRQGQSGGLNPEGGKGSEEGKTAFSSSPPPFLRSSIFRERLVQCRERENRVGGRNETELVVLYGDSDLAIRICHSTYPLYCTGNIFPRQILKHFSCIDKRA